MAAPYSIRPATVDDVALVRVLAASPRVELEVDVGASTALARAAARLLDRLESRSVHSATP